MFKYKFKAIVQDNQMKELREFMRKLDLNIGEIGLQLVFTFSSKSDHDIPYIKEHLKMGFEYCNINLIHLDGKKIE
jgi:hypothetical protein